MQQSNNDKSVKIIPVKESPKLKQHYPLPFVRRGTSLNSYNFEPSFLPPIGVLRHCPNDINVPPLSRIEQNCKFSFFFIS